MSSTASPDLGQQAFGGEMDIPSTSSSARPIDIPPSSSYRLSGHWPESIDFNSASGFAYTPSYVGSFGSQQESALNNWGERESTAVLQSHNPSSGDLFDDVKYEPEAYGPADHVLSGHASPYMMDNQGNIYNNDAFAQATDMNFVTGFDSAGTDPSSATAVARHFSPRSAGEMYSAGSPASSIGGFADPQLNSRSRASSVSSYHDASPYMQSTDYNTAVSEHFDRLNFEGGGSDAWVQQTAGQAFNQDMSPPIQSPEFAFSSPPGQEGQQQATSPPALMIPAESVPTVRGPDEDHDGPRSDPIGNVAINFVPATPVSAGGVGGNSLNSFQKILADLARNRHQPHAFDRGNASTSGALPSISTFRTALDGGVGGRDSASTAAAPRGAQQQESLGPWGSILSATGQSQGTASSPQPQQMRPYHHGYNLPAIPSFNASSTNNSNNNTSISLQQPSTSASTPSAAPTTSNNMSVDLQPSLAHHSQSDSVLSTSTVTAGAGGHLGLGAFTPNSDTGLNIMGLDDMSFLSAPILSSRSRSKSDVSARPPMWSFTPPVDPSSSTTSSQMQQSLNPYGFNPNQQQQRSGLLDIFPAAPASTNLDQTLGIGGDFAGSLKRANSDGGRAAHRRGAKSEDLSAFRVPRLGPVGQSNNDADYIRSVTMADGSLAPVDPRVGVAGPTRRRGSGSGHERNSSLSSLRSTPYSIRQSPLSSPGQSPHHSPAALPVPLHDPSGGQAQQSPQQPVLRVERALVTTPATKTASANRRRAEANFVCPVPGCGSTFTRHFNLRGHMRSHNEERPFKCKWPGCEKGFARQHDCKRHEALHLNIRPYTCEGCQKTFARMDALNRHLRSEGGVDCQKAHQSSEDSTGDADSEPKVEDSVPVWNKTGPIMM